MGKVKTVIMGDLEAEEKSRRSGKAKREQKKADKKATKEKNDVAESPTTQEVEKFEAKNEAEESTGEPKKVVKKKTSKTENKYSFKPGKKYVNASSLVDKNKTYSLSEALDLVKRTSYSKFDGTVEVHLNVADKGLRGNVTLPHGTGKQVRVAIADDTLINSISSGSSINFDILVAHPSFMPKLAKVAKILGPRGLMPNPKTNTIGEDPEKLVKQLSSSVSWKTEPTFPIIHTILGKVSFDSKKLEENYQALVKSIGKDKIRSVFLKPTMGPSVKLLM